MAYLVLARKWRPQDWEGLVGQDHVTATLKNAIRLKRLAHAYLFAGPRGVGKTSAARILAKALNCEQGPTVTPCNACVQCEEISQGRSVDVFEIDGASNRGIEEIRNLRENIRYAPAHGRYKIYIIDEVHMLTNEAFNALLKTLEEPPEHVLFVFATTEPHRVPPTIVSRCQRFDFHRIPTPLLIRQLKRIGEGEGLSIEEEALALIARKADGSLRDAESILDQMISFADETITAEKVRQALGMIALDVFFDVTDAIVQRDPGHMLRLVDRIVAEGVDLEEFLAGLAEHLRRLLIVSASQDSGLLEVSPQDEDRYRQVASAFDPGDLLRLIRVLTDGMVALKHDPNPRIPLEVTLLKMVHLDRTVSIAHLIDLLSHSPSGEEAPSSEASPQPPPLPVAPDVRPAWSPAPSTPLPSSSNPSGTDSKPPEETSPPPSQALIPFGTILDRWDEVLAEVKRRKVTIGSFLKEGKVHRLDGDTLEILFSRENGFHIDAIMRSRRLVEETLQACFGKALKIRCIKGDANPDEASATEEDREKRIEALKARHPLIQKLIDDFDVEWIE